MNRKALLAAAALSSLLAGGCLAKSAFDLATLPVRAAGKAVDWATTSQSEADRNYGRKVRRQEDRERAARRQWETDCRKHGKDDCAAYAGYRAAR